MRTSGHTVLITGGASGIGFALAKQFHAAGNKVIIVGRNTDSLKGAAAALPGITTMSADISIPADRKRLATEFPDTSILINNAGIQHNVPITESCNSQIEHELQVNFLVPVLLTKDFLPALSKHQESAIINISSALAVVPKESAPIYCASKAALHSFSKTLRWQLEGSSVRVFDILPPLVATPMTAGRGNGKISPAKLAREFWSGFKSDTFEMKIGKSKLLCLINRIAPPIAERIIRKG